MRKLNGRNVTGKRDDFHFLSHTLTISLKVETLIWIFGMKRIEAHYIHYSYHFYPFVGMTLIIVSNLHNQRNQLVPSSVCTSIFL